MYNLCCISNELKEDGYSFQSMTWKRFNELRDTLGIKQTLHELGTRWLNNVCVTYKIIKHCYNNGWGYRISSDLFPVLTHPDFKNYISDVPQYQDIMETFKDISNDNKTWNVRISCHPDQFNVLASEDTSAVSKTIRELSLHSWIMDQMGATATYHNPINIHINCSKGNLAEIAERFAYWLDLCMPSVKNRLVVENEDKGVWNVENLYNYFYIPYGIPITFDNLHHKCNPGLLSEQEAIKICSSTWHGYKPLFHYSESDSNNKNQRAHAEYPTDKPCSDDYDWDIELKGKDKAIRMISLIQLSQEAQELNLGY